MDENKSKEVGLNDICNYNLCINTINYFNEFILKRRLYILGKLIGMIFKDAAENFVEINRYSFINDKHYYETIMKMKKEIGEVRKERKEMGEMGEVRKKRKENERKENEKKEEKMEESEQIKYSKIT